MTCGRCIFCPSPAQYNALSDAVLQRPDFQHSSRAAGHIFNSIIAQSRVNTLSAPSLSLNRCTDESVTKIFLYPSADRFSTLSTNLLTIPSTVIGIITMFAITVVSETVHERSLVAM